MSDTPAATIDNEPNRQPELSASDDDYWAVGVKPKPLHNSDDCCERILCFDSEGVAKYGRVGNFTILSETRSTGGKFRTLNCVLGPSWKMMLFITVPCLVAVPLIISLTVLSIQPLVFIILYPASVLLVLLALYATATVDPGIVRRYRKKPVSTDVEAGSVANGTANYGTSGGRASEGEWIWCDNADTWRRNTAKYSSEADCVIEQVDHHCNWTGTIIARDNLCAFYLFVAMIFVLFYFSMFLIGSYAIGDPAR